MILIGHGLEQVDAGLMLQGDVAFELRQNLLFQFAHGALAVEQVADKKECQRAKSKERGAQRPPIPDRVEEHQRVHEHGEAGGLHENKGSGENREMQLAAF